MKARFEDDWILFEAQGLLVVRKPSGLLTHATADKSRENLVDLLRTRRPDLTALTLQHRLDRETSGLLLFTTSDDTRAGVARQFAEREVGKEYLCWVRGKKLPAAWTVDAPLQERSGRMQVGPGQAARTDFALRRRNGPYCLLTATPWTGRKHQIRVHLAHRGLPIVGDALFGGEPNARLLLHAYKLEITHPVSGERLHWTAEPEADFEPQADPQAPGRAHPGGTNSV